MPPLVPIVLCGVLASGSGSPPLQRPIPRHQQCRAVHRAGRAVHHADHLPLQPGPRGLSAAVRPQPDGRRYGADALDGAPRSDFPAWPILVMFVESTVLSLTGAPVLRPRRAQLRRPDLSMSAARHHGGARQQALLPRRHGGERHAAVRADGPRAAPARCRRDHRAPASKPFWALRDVSLEVEPGEVVGLIGPNGAGKSTLLKLLARITPPTEGRIELRGRVASLLEVGTGFHPELTGRENVFLNGAILGLRRQEIARQFDAIVEFSGVEKFIDTPVKRYSSGMSVRLVRGRRAPRRRDHARRRGARRRRRRVPAQVHEQDPRPHASRRAGRSSSSATTSRGSSGCATEPSSSRTGGSRPRARWPR